MIEGESGLLSVFPAHQRPVYEPSKRRVTFHTGAVATTFTSEKPDQLRGPQHDTAWCDEIAAWRYPDAWKQLTMGLRLGRPRVVLTTTPRPTPLVRELIAHKRTHITRGHTKDNAANLADEFLEEVDAAAGTRLGRQEFGAELLEEIEGALWTLRQIEARVVRPEFRIVGEGEDADYAPVLPTFVRTVISVDPAAKATPKKPRPGETGIVAVGLDELGFGWVLDDASGVYKPSDWAAKTVELFDRWNADRVVAEDNQGGDMVESTLRAARVSLPIKRVTAITGKAVRAEPVAAFYEPQAGYPLGRVRHLGHHADLETQMTTWVPTGDAPSPDRLDALVHGLTELLGREKKPKTKGWSQPVFDRDD
jgi:phage terminase large subunit-like protein